MSDLLLTDPFQGTEEEDECRINADIPKEVRRLLQTVYGFRGILQASVNMFIKAIYDDCQQQNIKTYADREQLIAIIRRRTGPLPIGQTNSADDGKRTARPRARAKKLSNAEPNTTPKAAKRVRRKKENNQEGKTSEASDSGLLKPWLTL